MHKVTAPDFDGRYARNDFDKALGGDLFLNKQLAFLTTRQADLIKFHILLADWQPRFPEPDKSAVRT